MGKRLFSLTVALFLIVSTLMTAIPVALAGSVYVRPKKTVYLVMDDSGSMDGQKENDANYALQTFLSVLDKNEQVVIYFLNEKNAIGDIDISKKSNDMISNVRIKYPNSVGGTPFDVVKDAAEDLRKASAKDPSREYWLVVITDGGFGGGNPQNYMEKFTSTPLKNKEYPKFLYVGIGGGSVFTVPQGAENRFFLESSPDIIEAMNNAVIHITNRHVVKAKNTDSKTISFELPYPARNIVVLAQTYKTKIESYNAISQLNIDEIYRIEYPINNPPLQHSTVGYITEKNSSSIKNGTVSLTFDSQIDASKVIVMVEPAIGINAVYTGEGGQQINPQDMQVDEDITVQMTICDSITNDPLPVDSVLGKVDQYITVNGTRYDGGTVNFTVPEKDLEISLVAEFPDGFVLDIQEKVTDLVRKKDISLFVSDSGYFEADIKDLNSVNGIVVTPLINGSNLTPEEMKKASLTISGGGLFTNRFNIVPDETTGTYTIHPKAGLFKIFTPLTEQNFEITFSDGEEKTIKDTITVKITGKRPIAGVIIAVVLILLAIYLIYVEITRIRFPRGAYVKYYTVTRKGKPDTSLSDRIYLNRPSWDKIKNGSYLPIPHTSYKVSGQHSCEGLTFVAYRNKTSVKVNGVEDLVITDEYGGKKKTTSFIPVNENGRSIAVEAPIEDEKIKTKFLLLPVGYYIKHYQNKGCAEISVKNRNQKNNISEGQL